MTRNRQIILAHRPEGMPDERHLTLRESPMPRPHVGEALVKTIYLSLDPYMRGRMSAAKSYAPGVELGAVMEGATVSQVVAVDDPALAVGDYVLAPGGWQEFAVVPVKALHKLDPAAAPISTALGVLGMPGFTAYVGLDEIGQPRAGETLVVSAAAGAVGQVVGQIAKIRGARVVGVAGADDKCRRVVQVYGFDAGVNYKHADFAEKLAAACPDGVDVYYENVGGIVFDTVRELLNDFARIPVCGRIAHYNDSVAPAGPDRLVGFMSQVLVKRLLVQGFIQFDYRHRQHDFQRDMSAWLRDGRIQYQEDIVAGLENAVQAFQGLLQGRNRGKLLVQVAEDPTRG